jgi:hypothetical protein
MRRTIGLEIPSDATIVALRKVITITMDVMCKDVRDVVDRLSVAIAKWLVMKNDKEMMVRK